MGPRLLAYKTRNIAAAGAKTKQRSQQQISAQCLIGGFHFGDARLAGAEPLGNFSLREAQVFAPRDAVAVNLEQNAMVQPLPIMIGYALWFIFVIAWNVTARPAPAIATPGARRERLYAAVISLGLSMIVVAPFLLVRRGFQIWISSPLLAWGMLLLVAAGIALCWWARLHLGSLWSANVTRKEGHRVVDSGPYRLVRHPIYTGFIVMDLGLAILCGSALALVGVAVVTVGLWLKARVEEQFLSEELGAAAYGAYRARTPMLVPRMPRRPTRNSAA